MSTRPLFLIALQTFIKIFFFLYVLNLCVPMPRLIKKITQNLRHWGVRLNYHSDSTPPPPHFLHTHNRSKVVVMPKFDQTLPLK